MNILYIGQYQPGSTSRMRGEVWRAYFKDANFNVIDTSLPFEAAHRVWRSLAFRYKKGPLINRINKYITDEVKRFSENTATTDTLTPKSYSLIWVDKAVFVTRETTLMLREISDRLVHFTPDMAFYENRSKNFFQSISIYDFVITTKTSELQCYQGLMPKSSIILTTQGYDKTLHKPCNSFEEKLKYVAFIGLAEPSRFAIVEKLIQARIEVRIAGKGWYGFFKKYASNPFFRFEGEGLFGEDYARFISNAYFSIGLLSKRFPELHTTRTFEIPACGTALVTERNVETSQFFTEEEAIFYDTPEEMVERIRYYLAHPDGLKVLTAKGQERVHRDGRDYECILNGVLDKVMSIV